MGKRGNRHAMYVKRHARPVETVPIPLDGEAIAAPRGHSPAEIGHYMGRPPPASVTLGDLAALGDPRLGKAAPGGDTERRH